MKFSNLMTQEIDTLKIELHKIEKLYQFAQLCIRRLTDVLETKGLLSEDDLKNWTMPEKEDAA